MIIATAGHVDHGKTSLIRALTGVDADRLAEEKRRGMTIDLGFAYAGADTQRYGFVDVPGHERFLHNMLAGVNGIDLGLLVIAADDSIMPQTREHVTILDLLGIPRCVVALTKIDRVTNTRIEDVSLEIRQFLQNTAFGDAPIVPVSSLQGLGIEQLQQQIATSLHLGSGHKDSRKHLFRLSVDRVFARPGVGTVVTGFIHSGEIRVGDNAIVLPQKSAVRVRGIHAMDLNVEAAVTGERAALNLVGIERDQLQRGDWICAETFGEASQRCLVAARWLDNVKINWEKSWRNVHLYHASAHCLARIHQRPDGLFEVRAQRPQCWSTGDRLIIRDAADAQVLGGATVLELFNDRRNTQIADECITAPVAGRELAEVAAQYAQSGGYLPWALLRRARNIPLDSLHQVFAPAQWQQIQLGRQQYWQHADHFASNCNRLIAAVQGWQKANPHLAGIRLHQLMALLPQQASPIVRALVRHCETIGAIKQSAGFLHTPDHRPRLEKNEELRWQEVANLLKNESRPPVVHELAKRLKTTPQLLLPALIRLQHFGFLVRVAENRFFLPEHVDRLATLAESLQNQGLTAALFRDASGLGRNLAVEVLEFFDSSGFTRRRGEERIVTRPAARWMRGER